MDYQWSRGRCVCDLCQDQTAKRRYKGISAFIVEREWGVKTGKPLHKMGQHASWTSEVFFEEVEVPAENRLGPEGSGFLTAMKVFDSSRPAVAAAAVGVARRAFEEAKAYAKSRIAYGKPIIAQQGVSFMLAEMGMNVEAGRLLAQQAAWLHDNGHANTLQAAYAKAFCADMCDEGGYRRRAGLRRLRL